MITRFDRIH